MAIAITYALLKTTQEATNRFLALPAPSGATWNENIEEQVYTQRDAEGVLKFDEAMTTGRQPAATLNYSRFTKEILALRLGRKLEEQALTGSPWAFSQRLTKLAFPANAAGFAGEGMVTDIASASYLKNGISTPLARQPFATFVPATAGSFAQGADGALKFSTDLLNKWVTVYGTYPETAADVLSEDLFGIFELTIFGVLQEAGVKEVFYLQMNPVQINLAENDETNFGANEVPIAFRSADPSCIPTLVFPRRKVAC
jgi:hypothetical protein